MDILVNNAGILLHGLVDDYALTDFERMVAVNVRAVFVAVQAALPHMPSGGRIITTGSVAADRTGFPGASVYTMTKAAVAALTRGLARDLGPRGITVNTVQPGPTESDMSAGAREIVTPLLATGRMGKDTEIASLVAYLAGPESAFITGSALTIDGGYLRINGMELARDAVTRSLSAPTHLNALQPARTNAASRLLLGSPSSRASVALRLQCCQPRGDLRMHDLIGVTTERKALRRRMLVDTGDHRSDHLGWVAGRHMLGVAHNATDHARG